MYIKDFLKKTAYLSTMEICGKSCTVYKSKFDGSYMTHKGMEDKLQFLADREITKDLTHGIGFSPKDDKWYGWSHRAIFGFKVGSTCKKGDCHYRAANEKDEIEAAIRFWSSDNHINVAAKKMEDGTIYVSWEYENEISLFPVFRLT